MILFRCDGNAFIGAGHIMRCLSIANAAKAIGQHCVFLTSGNEFETVIAAHGHDNKVFFSDYQDISTDIEDTKAIINTCRPEAVIVDSYYITDSYLRLLKEVCKSAGAVLVYIDDILSFPYPCDVLLNYNIYGPDKKLDYCNNYTEAGEMLPQLLLGTAYAPLRSEFTNLSERRVRKMAMDILISTGGADSQHMSIWMVKVIKGWEKARHYNFHFIIGALNQELPVIKQLKAGEDNIVIHYNVNNMAELMNKCDVAISAAGSTLYELCATQTPAITYILADNQILGAEGFERNGVLKNAGDVRRIGAEKLSCKLIRDALELCDDYEERCRIVRRQREIVDGRGAERIVQRLTE